MPGAGVLSVVEYDKLLESVGGGCSYEGTVMRAFLTFGVSLLLRGGHAAAVSLEGLGAIPLSGTQDQACMAFAVSLPPFKNVMAPRLVYVLRHVDALKCSGELLAVMSMHNT